MPVKVYELKQGTGWKWTGSGAKRDIPRSLPESEMEKPALHLLEVVEEVEMMQAGLPPANAK